MGATFSLAQLGLSLAAGGLTTLSPCVFPLLPLVVGGAVQANPWSPVAMGVGMATSFALIGMALGAAILTGGDKWLEARIVAILPDAWIALTTRF